jgi:hypothetical protein
MDVLLQKLAEWTGLGAAFTVAASVYYFFHLADSRASREAKEAILNWMKPLPYDAKAVSLAILEIFDRLYSYPLLSWRAFRRSAVFSIAAFFVISIIFWIKHRPPLADVPLVIAIAIAIISVIFVVVDYLSLFLVRKLLVLSSGRPWLAISSGVALGILIIEITSLAS